MKEIIEKLKGKSLTFISLNIYLLLIILIPKEFSELFGILPIRTFLTYLLFIIFLYDKKKNNIELNNFNFKWIGITYILFLLFSIPSLSVTKNLLISVYTFIKFLSFLLLLYVCVKIKLKKEDYIAISKNILVCSSIKFIWGIIEYVFEINLFTVGAYKYPGAKGRVTSQFFNTIYFGIFINLIFGYIFYLFSRSKNKLHQAILGIYLILGYINLLLTFTRSSFLVFFGILFLILILLNKKILNKVTIILICILFGVSFMIPGVNSFSIAAVDDAIGLFTNTNLLSNFLPNNVEDNVTPDEKLDDYSLEHRKNFAQLANKIANDNLYTGIGFGAYIDYLNDENFEMYYPDYKLSKTHPHSSFVLMFAEVSFIALTFFCLFLFNIFINIIKNIKNNRKEDEIKYCISLISLSVFIGFVIVNVIAENAFYDTQIFPIFLLIIGLSLNFTFKCQKYDLIELLSNNNKKENIKKLKKYELKVLDEVTKICKENNIDCYLAYGSVLGAVRHNGFIPWDDDIDLHMFGSDICKLKKICKKELNKKFYFQDKITDKYYYNYWTKIGLEDTTWMPKKRIVNCKYGICVDIFPMFPVKNTNKDKRRMEKYMKILLICSSKYYVINNSEENYNRYKIIIHKLIPNFLNNIIYNFVYKKLCFSYKNYDQIMIYDITNNEYTYFDKEDIIGNNVKEFENRKLLVPSNTDKYLSTYYGKNYMTPPKMEDRYGHDKNDDMIYDFNNSYKKYLR